MKKLLLIALSIIPMNIFAQLPVEKMDVLTVIHQRKSVRQFTEQKVEREKLEICVRAGMAAPTAMNRQPWAFIVIDDSEILQQLAQELGGNKILSHAPAAIVVCGNLEKAVQSVPDYWVQDCSAATQNILLAVEGIGLGAVWIGVFPRDERIQAVKNVTRLPKHLVPLNVIAIGYPKGEHTPKDKWKSENVFWNVYLESN
jgi:nitroreductase